MVKSLEHPLVGVVTPVFNGETFLAGAIESVLEQNYSHWDYLIVNNRSTDRTLEIARSYADRDRRIRVVTNEVFVNAEQNHNLAFRQIPPEARYCKTVSADDRLLPSCLSKMVAFAVSHPSAGIINSLQRRGDSVQWQGLPAEVDLLPGREACRMALLKGLHVFGNPTSSLYRADLLRGPASFFPHSKPHADTSACYVSLRECDFGFVHEVLSEEGVHGGQISCQVDELGMGIAAYLETLNDYGPVYLSDDEYKSRLRELLAAYDRYLGGCLLKLKSRAFWSYHEREMRKMNRSLDWRSIAGAALAEIRQEAGHPLVAWQKLRAVLADRALSWTGWPQNFRKDEPVGKA